MKEILATGAMALMLMGQQPAGQQQQGQPASAIPDAPRPQLATPNPLAPQLGPVTPGSGTTPTSNGDTSTLPSGPVANNTAEPLPPVAPEDRLDPNEAPPDLTTGPAYVIRQSVNLREVPFLVKDNKGRLVPGIDWREVRIYENGVRQHVSFYTVDPFPLSVALVVDNSLDYKTMERVDSSLGALQAAFTPYDSVSVFTYNHGTRQLTKETGGQSARLTQAIEGSKARGNESMYYAPGEGLGGGINLNNGQQNNITPLSNNNNVGSPRGVAQVEREVHTLNDGIFEAAKSLSKAAKGRRRIIYVISDGKEYGSVNKSKDVIRFLQSNDITVYATLVGDSSVAGMGFIDSLHLPLMMRDNILPVYTKATGGEFYAEYRQKGIEQSFQRITEEVRTQYTLGYYSNTPITSPAFRTNEVKILRPNLSVIAPRGYYPTPRELTPQTGTPVPQPTAAPPSK